MHLSEFINASKATDNNDGTWSVIILLQNGKESKLVVDDCESEYDAKERAYLYLQSLLNK